MIHPIEAFSNLAGIEPNAFEGYQVICLPENAENTSNRDELFDASGSVELSKKLKAAGLKCANSADLGMDVPTLERRSSELWLGLIWIIDNIAIPAIVGVISNLLWSKFKKSKDLCKMDPSQRTPPVHLCLRIDRGMDSTKIDYVGDPETLINVLNSINNKNKEQN